MKLQLWIILQQRNQHGKDHLEIIIVRNASAEVADSYSIRLRSHSKYFLLFQCLQRKLYHLLGGHIAVNKNLRHILFQLLRQTGRGGDGSVAQAQQFSHTSDIRVIVFPLLLLHGVQIRYHIRIYRVDHQIIHIIEDCLIHLPGQLHKVPDQIRIRTAKKYDNAVAAKRVDLQVLKIDLTGCDPKRFQLLPLVCHPVSPGMGKTLIAAIDKQHVPKTAVGISSF